MYLSRVEIDINDRRRMRDLKHLGCYHGWIEDSFPEERDKEKMTMRENFGGLII